MTDQLFNPQQHPDFGEIVSSYSRAEALLDGVLVATGSIATEAGFRCPVALTAAAWADCVSWCRSDTDAQVHQDETGRLWDVLFMAAYAGRAEANQGKQQIHYQLYRVPRDGCSTRPELTTLKLVIGPGDHHEPVITIMLPSED